MKFELPDLDVTAWYKGPRGHTVKLQLFSDDLSDPTEDDGFGIFYSFSGRHINFLKLDRGDLSLDAALTQRFGAKHEGWVPLSYFEHGRCLWFPETAGKPAGTEVDFRWDGVTRAGIWVVTDTVRKNIGPCSDAKELRNKLLVYCAENCETYSAWCNGEGCAYYLQAWKEGAQILDRFCGGFLGDYEKSGILNSLEEELPEGVSLESLEAITESEFCISCLRPLAKNAKHRLCRICAAEVLEQTK